jgi:hypothetical protein
MTLQVRPYSPSDAEAWDDFCEKSLQATLLHTRRFLSYHGDRFTDCSLVIEEGGNWLGVFPAALSPTDRLTVVSHPGVTYGGIVHHGTLRGGQSISSLQAIVRHYAEMRLSTLIYKPVPIFYHQAPAQDDLYALFRLGAVRTRCDISCTIDMQRRLPVSERRRRGLKKAAKSGVAIAVGPAYLGALWDVLYNNLRLKHGVAPVHSLREIELLAQRFPSKIHCICGVVNGKVEAGTLLFITPTAHHAQYIASSDIGHNVAALDAVFEYCISQAGYPFSRWFDFGISTEDKGTRLNDGLFRFKSEFGAGATIYEFYQINLDQINHATG